MHVIDHLPSFSQQEAVTADHMLHSIASCIIVVFVALQTSQPISRQVQQTCAECLGMLGAVDPARVQVLRGSVNVQLRLHAAFACACFADRGGTCLVVHSQS